MKKNKTNKYSLVGCILFVAVMISSCVITSLKEPLWFDELIFKYLVSDDSFGHMFRAIIDKVELSLPFSYIVTWGWVRLFGDSDLAIRLLSSIGICGGGILVFKMLRKTYGVWPAAVGTLSVFCASSWFLYQNSEARFYGLFLFLCAADLFLYQRCSTRGKDTAKLLVPIALVNGAMITTHLYGFIYSFVVIGAVFFCDRKYKEFRPNLYLAGFAGWFCLLPWLRISLGHMTFIREIIGKHGFWTEIPQIGELLETYGFGIGALVPIAIVLMTLYNLGKDEDKQPARIEEERSKMQAYYFAMALFSVPLFCWISSQFTTPLFVYRYFLPSAIGLSTITAWFIKEIETNVSRGSEKKKGMGERVYRVTAVLVSLVLLSVPVVDALRLEKKPPKDISVGSDLGEAGDLPIVFAGHFSSALVFLPKVHYAENPEKIIFLLDEEVSSKNRSLFQNEGMDAFKRNYLPENIQDAEEFLAANDSFLVYNSDDALFDPAWFKSRILNNPTFKYKLLEGKDLIWVKKTD